ncbi:MAG: glycosyltransferase family 2 protein [Methanothrix sp.]|nr:glycosyltransferase family 2 protein [Methanothrix sp.]
MAGSLSVVVPVYNSEEILPRLLERLEQALDPLGCEYEIILVNDASRDGSWNVIQELAAGHRRVVGINLMRNYGQHNAQLCGIRAARHEITVTMDDDLQHPPEEIPTLLAELSARGADVVYGRPEREQHGLWRNLASRATKLAMERMIGATNARDISSFRVFRTRLRDGFASFQSPFVSIDVLLTWSTAKTTAIHVRRDPRTKGKSNYNTWKLVVGTVNVITAFSTLPLRVATLLGFLMAFFGTGVMGYVLMSYLRHGSIPGFPFLACTIAIFAGTQLLALGIIGEYLGRIFLRSMGRPVYAIKDVAGTQRAVLGGEKLSHEQPKS